MLMFGLSMMRCLARYRLHCVCDLFWIPEVIVTGGLKLFVQFVHEGNSRGDIQFDDIGVGNAIEMLHQRAETISMTGYQEGLSRLHGRRDPFAPVRKESRSGILQALRGGEPRCRHLAVAGIARGVPWILQLQSGGPDVVAAAPELDLLIAVLFGGLGLVQPLQRAVVPLVQSPIPMDRNPHEIHLIQHDPEGPDGALED